MTRAAPFPLRLAGPGGAGGAGAACPAALRAALEADPAAVLASATVLKESRRTLVARVEGMLGAGSPGVTLKRYRSGGLRWRLGLGRARRAAWRLVQLRAAGVAAPEPLAWLEGPHGGFVVTPFLDGATGVDRALATAVPSVRRAATRALAACIGHLHAAGFAHRDLKAANLLTDGAAVWLVDVDGARRAPLAGAERRARDLRRLWRSLAGLPLGRTDCGRFAAAYAAAVGTPAVARGLLAAGGTGAGP